MVSISSNPSAKKIAFFIHIYYLSRILLSVHFFISCSLYTDFQHGDVSKTGIVMNIQELSGLVRLDISSIYLAFYTSRMNAYDSL